MAEDAREGLLHGLLDGGLAILALPAAIGGPVIFEGDSESAFNGCHL
jgi:hypothetical protein